MYNSLHNEIHSYLSYLLYEHLIYNAARPVLCLTAKTTIMDEVLLIRLCECFCFCFFLCVLMKLDEVTPIHSIK